MARYYKTDKPEMLDYMYELPEKYMLAAVQQASQDIDKNAAAMYDLYGKLQVNALPNDKAKADKKLAYYENKINETSKALQQNPLEFRRMGSQITGLGQELHRDMTRGELAAYQSNYNTYTNDQVMYQDMYKKGKLKDLSAVQKLTAYNLNEFGGTNYDPATGTYKTYNPEKLLQGEELSKSVQDAVAKMKPQIVSSSSADFMLDKAGEPQFIVERQGKRQVLTRDQIMEAAMSDLVADQDQMAYLAQMQKIGVMGNVFNEDGSLISPYTTRTAKTKDGREMTVFDDYTNTPLGNSLRAAVKIYEKDDTLLSKTSIKNVSGRGKSGSTRQQLKNTVIDVPSGKLTVESTPEEVTRAFKAHKEQDPTVSEINHETIDALNLSNITRETEALQNAGIPLITSISSALDSRGIESDIVERIGEALRISPDADLDVVTDNLTALLNEAKNDLNIETDDFRIIEEQMEAIDRVRMEAFNNKQIHSMLEDAANQGQGTSINDMYFHPDYIRKTLDLNETAGDYYDGEDAADFNKGMDNLIKKFNSSPDLLGPAVTLLLQDEKGEFKAFQMSREKFLKTYNFLGDTADKEVDTGINVSGTQRGSGSKSTTKQPKAAKFGSAILVKDDVPYTDMQNNSQVIRSPFRLTLSGGGHDNVSILLTDEPTSQLFRDLDSRYAWKDDMTDKIRDIKTRLLPVETAKNIQGFNKFAVKEVQLLDGVYYTPPVAGGKGKLRFVYGESEEGGEPLQRVITETDARAVEEYKKFFNNR